ncbi:MAG: hypothetical protein CM15mP12_3270 [Gammaproteobacteria bacterium]|nr:MAG: hypothetical protein CM15mP12_3270 [Gammaproteobacteria bacterium]
MPTLCNDLKQHLKEGQEVVSVAAGSKLEEAQRITSRSKYYKEL